MASSSSPDLTALLLQQVSFESSSGVIQHVTPNPHLTGIEPKLGVIQPLPLTLEELTNAPNWESSVPTKDFKVPLTPSNGAYKEGVELNVRLFYPSSEVYTSAKKEYPILIYIHGGGWVRGTLNSYNPICSRLAALGLIVASVEYRLAPGNKFPGPMDDCIDAIQWVIANRGSLRGSLNDQKDFIIVGGDSAGGQLTGSSAIKLIQTYGELPKPIVGLILVYPATDATMSAESWKTLGNDYRLTAAVTERMWNWHLNADDVLNPLASIKFADKEILKKFPATLIFSAEFDPLRDETEQFVQLLHSSGAKQVHAFRVKSTIHSFFSNGSSTNMDAFEDYSSLALLIVQKWILHSFP